MSDNCDLIDTTRHSLSVTNKDSCRESVMPSTITPSVVAKEITAFGVLCLFIQSVVIRVKKFFLGRVKGVVGKSLPLDKGRTAIYWRNRSAMDIS